MANLPPVPASEESLLLEVLPLAMLSVEPPRARRKSVLRYIKPQWCPTPRIAAIYRDMKALSEDTNFLMWFGSRVNNTSEEFRRWAEAMNSPTVQTADIKLIGEHLKAEYIKRQDQQLLSDYMSAETEAVKVAALDKLRKLYKETTDDNTEDILPNMELPPVCYCLQSPDGIDFAPKREICAIKGRAKHGKTHLLSIFLAAMLQPQQAAVCGVSCNHPGMHILYIDTEQSKSSSRKILRGALRMAGLDPLQPCPFVDMKNMRKEAKTRRKEKIEELVSTGRYDVVIVDGIKDLCLDFNNLVEADQLMVDVLDMIETYNVAYITVLHENPSGDSSKMRGHLGTEVENKSFEVFQSKKKDDIFNITNTERREKNVATFAFRFNDDDQLEQCEPNDDSNEGQGQGQKSPDISKEEKNFRQLVKAFGEDGMHIGFTKEELKGRLIQRCDVSEGTAWNRIKQFTLSGHLKNDGEGEKGSRYYLTPKAHTRWNQLTALEPLPEGQQVPY